MSDDLILADLHLPVAPQKASFLNEAFLRFCTGPARAAGRVFLLGDLFEHWVGDDVSLAHYPREVAALKALSDSGVRVYYQTGNRDFMLGRDFRRATGAVRLADEQVETLAGVPTLLAHGDQYCSEDLAYQRWRRFSRQGWAQWLYLRLPAARRERIATGLRKGSVGKTAAILDVSPAAIDAALRWHGVMRIIHGHTHRPAEHGQLGGKGERIVLADWRPGRIEWLRVGATGWRRETLAVTTQ